MSSTQQSRSVYELAGEYMDNDDDDMSFHPSAHELDEDEDEDSEGQDIMEFLDAEETLDEDDDVDEDEEDDEEDNDEEGEVDAADLVVQMLAAAADEDEMVNEAEQDAPTAREPSILQINRNQLLQLLGPAAIRHIFYSHGRGTAGRQAADDEDEDDDESPVIGFRGMRSRRRGGIRSTDQFPKVPSDEGRALMDSGTFGTTERCTDSIQRKKKLAASIMRRELGLGGQGQQRSLNRTACQGMLPSSKADTIINYNRRCYSGQFSDDGNFFFSCSQDFRVRMYDTSNPYKWVYYKTVEYPYGQWTITDASLSPDNRFLAYSSIRSVVCLAPTDPNESSEPFMLNIANTGVRRQRHVNGGHFGIWSIRFSGDGREIVAGTADKAVYVHDLETRTSILRIGGHEDDVNAVCFGDKTSPHILYSGSDDTTLKVWDRRSMGDGRAAGVFLGHTEGLTYVDSKGDGRYVLSNGKDQTMKLWDLRKMMSTDRANKIDVNGYSTGFDYRFMTYDDDQYRPHPHDCSLVTFRGHKVLKTLIRCHFSPPDSTDSRYVYSGSEDGSVYIYNLDATLAGKVDVTRATQDTRPRSLPHLLHDHEHEGGQWKTCVRDASWHPNAPVIAATSWNGWGMQHGTCTIHTWNDGLDEDEADPHMGLRVDAELRHNEDLYDIPSARGGARRAAPARTRIRLRRRAAGDDMDDDE